MSPLLALLAFQAATIDPMKDPAYAKPITLHLAMSPLNTVVAAIAKESGQPLDVSGVVTNWKATVLVRALPAGRTMEALADTLGLVWVRDGSSIRLSRPEGSGAAEAAYIKAELTEREKISPTINRGGGFAPGINRPVRRPGRPMRTSEGGGGAPVRVVSRFDPNLLAMEGSETPPPSRLDPGMVGGETAYAKEIAAWPTMPKEVAPVWDVPIATPRLTPSQWEGGVYAVSDLLVAWHDASGLPVIADAFRLPSRTRGFNPGGGLAVLQALAETDGMSLKLADGVARLRHPAFWRLRVQEVPEPSWTPIERGSASVDAFAAFAAKLTAPQVAAFRSAEPPLSKVTTVALRESYPVLLLWNVLSAPARKALMNGEPVALSAVRNASNAYLYALREAPFYHAGDPTPVLAMDARKIGIFGKAEPKSVELRLSGEQGGGVTYLVNLP